MVIPILRERGASCPRRMPDLRPCTTARMRSSSHAVHAGRRRKKSPRQAPRPHAPSTANLNPPKRHEQGKHGGGRGPEAHSVLRPRQGSHRSRSGMRLSRRCFIHSSIHGAHQISDQRLRRRHRLRGHRPARQRIFEKQSHSRSLLRSREANKATDNRSNNMDDGRNSTPRPPLRAEARRAGGVDEVAAAPSPHRRTVK